MNISAQDNRIFTLDTLSHVSYGVIISKPDNGIDCRNADKVNKLIITADQPSGTGIFFAFNTGDDWFRIANDGSAFYISHDTPDFEALRTNGNTVSQLNAITNIPAFVKSLVRVAVAVSSSDPDNSVPSVKISADCSVSSQTLYYTEYSPVYDLGDNAVISELLFDTVKASGGTVDVSAKIIRPDDSESSWLTPEQIRGSQAEAVQVKAVYYAPTPGVSSAKISQLYINYYRNSSAVPSATGRIYSLTQDWYMNIKSARVNIRHSALEESTMKVYAAFRKSPGHVVKENLGVSTGERKTFQLSHTGGILFDSVKIFADNQQLFTGYDINGESARVTVTAPEGCIITVSYDYGYEREIWREMTLTSRVSLDDYDMSEYRLDTEGGFSLSAFMIETSGTSGHYHSQTLGLGTGYPKTYKLLHRAVKTPYVAYGDETHNTASLDPKNYALLEDTRLFRVAAPAGVYIRCNYDWQSEPVRIYQVTASYTD